MSRGLVDSKCKWLSCHQLGHQDGHQHGHQFLRD